MNPQRPFVRKIVYVVAICVLLLPLYLLARPTSTDRPGGILSQLRERGGMSQAQLGDIDPASATIKLATLGMRGVAANILWAKAANYKKKKDWTNLSATLNQITRLEPNFVSVWEFQAWNLTYNVSNEFDDYRQRYRWVIRGIDFLIEGIRYNQTRPRLPITAGRTISQKIGRADEHKEFRELFVKDDDFHERYKTPSLEERDNWLVGKRWFGRAEDLVKKGASLGTISEVIFFNHRPKCQMSYAEAIEDDGIFGEKAKRSWMKSADEWNKYGDRPIQTSFKDKDDKPLKIFLNERESFAAEANATRKDLDSLQPNLRREILWERWSKLSDQEQGASHYLFTRYEEQTNPTILAMMALLDERRPDWRDSLLPKRIAILTKAENETLAIPERSRTEDQLASVRKIESKLFETAGRAVEKLQVADRDVVERITGPDRSKAAKLADQIAKSEKMVTIIQNYRQIVNFEYWRRRAEVEQAPAALAARSAIYDGKQAFSEGRLPQAADAYGEGMEKWRQLFDDPEFADLDQDESIVDDVMDMIDDYIKVLEQLDSLFPDDFPLDALVTAHVYRQSSETMKMASEMIAATKTALAEGDLETALAESETGLEMWKSLLDEYPLLTLMASKSIGQQIFDTINRYGDVLEKRREPFPDNFALSDFLHLHVEQAEETLNARNAIAAGDLLRNQSKFPAAQEAYERGLAEWRKLLDKFPVLLLSADKGIANELAGAVAAYEKILQLRGKEFPQDFILSDVREKIRPAQ